MPQPFSSNASDRIIERSSRRQRAQVPVPRAASIVEPSTQAPHKSLTEPEHYTEPKHFLKKSSTQNSVPQELELEKGTTIRLERTVFRETKLDGVDKDYNRDTFLEAAWLVLKDYPEIKDKVIQEAQRRSVLRREYGRTRAALTMGQRVADQI